MLDREAAREYLAKVDQWGFNCTKVELWLEAALDELDAKDREIEGLKEPPVSFLKALRGAIGSMWPQGRPRGERG